MAVPPASPEAPGRNRADPSPPAPIASLSAMVVLTAFGILAGVPAAVFAAFPFLLIYLALEWGRLLVASRVTLAACATTALVLAFRPDGGSVLAAAIARMTFLPAFLALLGFLRAAAAFSPAVETAGEYLVRQPPARRYLALTLGGNLFGILLNIGGLALLLDMTKRANTPDAAGGDPAIVEARERRMTLAVMRGFSAIALWSPLGVALNLLITLVPDLPWSEVGPKGMALTAGFLLLGWAFDHVARPVGQRAPPRADPVSGGARALAQVVGHIGAIAGIAFAAELALGRPFQNVLLLIVPLYAIVWLLALNIGRGEKAPIRLALAQLYENGIAKFSFFANEIAVFSASSFLGIALAALAPREELRHLITSLALPPGAVASGLCLTIFMLGMLGINPIISASILAGIMTEIQIPGLSSSHLVLALAAGWTSVIGVGPLMSSLILTSALIGRTPGTLGLRWNGRFAFTAVALFAIVLALVRF